MTKSHPRRIHDTAHAPRFPVARPRHAEASELLPYLQEIDTNGWYTNFGPLAQRLEERLTAHYHVAVGCVVTGASATSVLTATLLAVRAPRNRLCLMPAWTFVATAHAARAAGLEPYFVDVDPRSWALDPGAAVLALRQAPEPVAAIVAVSPFGQPLDSAAWEAVRDATNTPVVIDAAAGFDSVVPSTNPSIVSMHATKLVSSGEGGFVLCEDTALIDEIRARTNFGFHHSRLSAGSSVNAKLSEYGAAVGLANLAALAKSRECFAGIAESYVRGLDAMAGVARQPGIGDKWVSTAMNMLLPTGINIDEITGQLLDAGVETRRWWSLGCHGSPAFARAPRGTLKTTDALTARTLGLPMYVDMSDADVVDIVGMINQTLLAAQ